MEKTRQFSDKLHAPAVSAPCFNFRAENGVERKHTVFIMPIRTIPNQDGSISYAYACSLGHSCQNPYCRYAKRKTEDYGSEEELRY